MAMILKKNGWIKILINKLFLGIFLLLFLLWKIYYQKKIAMMVILFI
jgi:hypothetical protein